MPYEGERPATPIELMTRGLIPPGPFAPAITPGAPTVSEGAVRQQMNPDPAPAGPMGPMKPPENKLSGLRTVDPSEVTKLGGPLDYMAGNFKRNAPEIMSGTAAGLMPGGMLYRLAAAMGGGGLGGVIKGTDPLEEAGKAGLGQGAGELLTAPLKIGMVQRAGRGLLRGMAQNNDAAETAFKQGTEAQKTGYQNAVTQHAEQGATHIVDTFKQDVPSMAQFPSDTAGLRDFVHGKGQEVLSKSFDKSLKEIVAQGKGTMVPMTEADAQVLGIALPGFKERSTQDLLNKMTQVDAGELAQKITGKWKSEPDLYRRAFRALDDAGLGNAEARSEYRNGQALISFLDKSGAMKGGTLDPEALLKGLTDLKTVNQLRRRGAGDTFRGPLADVGNTIPKELSPLTPPTPQTPSDVGVNSITIPKWAGPAGAAAGGIAGYAGGHPYWGAGIGGGIGRALAGRDVITKAPLGPMQKLATDLGPTALGQLLRSLTGQKDDNGNP